MTSPMYPDDEANALIQQVNQANEDLAYDGSNEPQKRTLTARERDILCRIIGDILGQMRHDPPVQDKDFPFMWVMSPVHISIGEPNLLEILKTIHYIINPREDW